MPPVQTLRLLALSADPGVTLALEPLVRQGQVTLMRCADPAACGDALLSHRPDALLIDADLPHGDAAAAVREVRGPLCKDWLPIVLVGADEAGAQALAAGLGDAVDFVFAKPFDPARFAHCENALRRMIGLRRVSRSALDRVSEGVILIDEHGIVRSFNAAAERLFGWSADEVIGRNVGLLMPPNHRERHDGYLEAYRRTGRARVIGIGREENALRKDGSVFPMQLTVADISDGSERRYVGVIQDLSMLREHGELQDRVLRDPLTGLPNRRAADEALARVAHRHAAGGPGYALLFCDVDRFKEVNDRHGHAVGDEVLRAVGRRLRNAVGARDLVARLSGDEFLVLLDQSCSLAEADAVALRVDRAASQPVRTGSLHVPVGVSVGAAVPLRPDEPGAAVLDRADRCMYEVKRARGGARPARAVSAP